MCMESCCSCICLCVHLCLVIKVVCINWLFFFFIECLEPELLVTWCTTWNPERRASQEYVTVVVQHHLYSSRNCNTLSKMVEQTTYSIQQRAFKHVFHDLFWLSKKSGFVSDGGSQKCGFLAQVWYDSWRCVTGHVYYQYVVPINLAIFDRIERCLTKRQWKIVR